jgi:hypothetical protein
VIRNTDQYSKLSCAVEQLNRAAATDLIIFGKKIRGWKESQLLCEEKSIFLVKERGEEPERIAFAK